MIKIAFTADSHIGQVQYGMSFRAKDYAKSFDEVLLKAKELHCDYAILGGDIFHNTNPSADAVRTVKHWVENFSNDSFHRVLSIDGNHDSSCGKWMGICGAIPLGLWRTGPFEMLDKDNPNSKFNKRLKIYGIDGGETDKILFELKFFATTKYLNYDTNILVLHLPLKEMANFSTQVSCEQIVKIIKHTNVKLILLGDIHDGKETVVDGIRFIYSGSPEITTINENPNKSFLVVSASLNSENEWMFDVQRIPIHTRSQISITVVSENDVQMLQEHLIGESMFHIKYNTSLSDIKKRITTIAKNSGVYFRTIPIYHK